MMASRVWRTVLMRTKDATLCYGQGNIHPLIICHLNTSPVTKRTYCIEGRSKDGGEQIISSEERTTELLNTLENKGVTRYSRQHTLALYQLLLDLGIKYQTIESQLSEMPDLLSHPISKWQDTSGVMVEAGVDSVKILQSIALCPILLKVQPQELRQTIAKLRELKVGKLNLLTLATRYPVLLFHPPKLISQRIKNLGSIFPPSELSMLIRNNPSVLTDKWTTVIDKIMYIHKVMGLEQPQIASSRALQKSLLHIKTRHQFLYRAGLYKTPDLLRDKHSHRHNHKLSDIMDTSDALFANKVAHLTELEYQVFCNMIVEEEEDGSPYADSEDEIEDLKANYLKKYDR